MRSISSKAVWRYAFGDPGFSKYVRDDFSVSRFLLERFSVSFGTRLLRESPFMNLLLQGRYSPEAGLPLHLRRDQYRILRERSDRITIVTDMLDSFLRSQHAGTIDAFSLSDFGSYVSSDQYRDVWTSIVTAGAPAARFCERQFLVRRPLPEAVARRVRRDSKLESSLEASDDSTFYSFVAGNLAWG